MISVVLCVGSNCEDPEKKVREAILWLEKELIQVECSEIYDTGCAKGTGNSYLNAVLKGFYPGNGIELEALIKDKEREMGRNSQCRDKGLVPIDIDIVICDGEIYKPWDYRQKFFKTGYLQITKK